MLELAEAVFGYRSAQGARQITAPISLSIGTGEIVALVGPSGIGKSTILRTIASLIPPLTGEVLVSGTRALGRRCWFEPQSPIFLPFRNVLQNALAAREFDRRLEPADIDAAGDMISRLGLGEAGSAEARQLSGGMQRRLALAQGLLAERPLLLLDEPLAELDLNSRQGVERLISEASSDQNRSVLFASHDIDSVVAVADRVVVLQAPMPSRAILLTVAELLGNGKRDPAARRADPKFASAIATVHERIWSQWNG